MSYLHIIRDTPGLIAWLFTLQIPVLPPVKPPTCLNRNPIARRTMTLVSFTFATVELLRSDICSLVIVGAGPVGLMLSTCLARWGYKIKHIDNRAEPTPTGRADGIQPRSLDLLRNMGLKSDIMAHHPARVYEVAFWDPASTGQGIARTGTWASCPDFIDARYPFTTLLHQGLIERVFISDLEKNGASVQRPWTIKGFTSDEKANPDYPVTVDLEHVDGTAHETIHAKYLFGGEGARSFIRTQLGIAVRHKDPIAHVWGVMDGVVKTDFPDIKVSTPQSS